MKTLKLGPLQAWIERDDSGVWLEAEIKLDWWTLGVVLAVIGAVVVFNK